MALKEIALGAGAFGDIASGLGSLGGLFGGSSRNATEGASALISQQHEIQKEFAKNGVRWRVEDAKAAGIHPAAALGMQMAMPSVSVAFPGEDESFADRLSRAGHNISRAMDSTRTRLERVDARADALRLEHMELQNQLLASQIARLQRDQVGPPMADPSDPSVQLHGTADVPLVENQTMQRTIAAPGYPSTEAGAITEMSFSAIPGGGYAVVPSKDWKDRGEDQLVPEAGWAIRNHLIPAWRSIGGLLRAPMEHAPPRSWLPKGAIGWRFDPVKLAYFPSYPRKGEDLRGKYISIK